MLDALDGAFPAGQLFEDWLASLKLGGGREIIDNFAVELITDADGDLIEIAEHVEHGEGDLSRALYHAAVAGRDKVEPTHASGSAGRGAEFAAVAAASAQLVSLVAENFGYKLARADCAGIRLDDRDDLLDFIGRNTRADRTVARDGIGRGNHRIDAEIGVLQRAELTLEKDILALLDGVMQEHKRVADIRSEQLLILHELVKNLLLADGGLVVEILEDGVLDFERVMNLCL